VLEQQFAEDRFNQLKKKKQPSKTGYQVKENVEASNEPGDLTSIVWQLKSTIGFSC